MPVAFAAEMKFISLSCKTCARISLAISVQDVNPIITIIENTVGLIMAASVRININRGRERKISMMREIIPSSGIEIFLFKKGIDLKLIKNGHATKKIKTTEPSKR